MQKRGATEKKKNLPSRHFESCFSCKAVTVVVVLLAQGADKKNKREIRRNVQMKRTREKGEEKEELNGYVTCHCVKYSRCCSQSFHVDSSLFFKLSQQTAVHLGDLCHTRIMDNNECLHRLLNDSRHGLTTAVSKLRICVYVLCLNKRRQRRKKHFICQKKADASTRNEKGKCVLHKM